MAISFRAAGTLAIQDSGTTIAPAAPSGIVSTDVALTALVYAAFPTQTTVTPPTGWTSLLRLATGTPWALEVFRALGSATFGTYTFNVTGTPTTSQAIGRSWAYIGVDNTTPNDATTTGQTNAASTTSTASSITTVTNNAMLVCIFGAFDPGGTAFTLTVNSPLTQRTTDSHNDAGAAQEFGLALGDQIISPAGATGTRTATISVSEENIGISVALRPQPFVTGDESFPFSIMAAHGAMQFSS